MSSANWHWPSSSHNRKWPVFHSTACVGRALYEELKVHVKHAIGPWKYPRWIEFVDSLPKTATGKIQRFMLRDKGIDLHAGDR